METLHPSKGYVRREKPAEEEDEDQEGWRRMELGYNLDMRNFQLSTITAG